MRRKKKEGEKKKGKGDNISLKNNNYDLKYIYIVAPSIRKEEKKELGKKKGRK